VRPSAAEQITATVPGSVLRVYDGIGHAPFQEDAGRFDHDLGEFVRAARLRR
jgi:non-heme chloroperoxidase